MKPPSNDSILNTEPVLNYNEPPNFYHAASKFPIEYQSSEANEAIRVYPFRPFTGDIQKMFEQTMLREAIDGGTREGALIALPQFARHQIPGATLALSARFHENIPGMPNERMRMLIVADNQAAIVDIIANSTFSWQKAGPSAGMMLNSLRVERHEAPPSVAAGPGPAAKEFAGLYMATRTKYVVNLFRPVGYGDTKLALHYFLFTPDGRVYRCYDFPPGGAGNDWRRFDFDKAEREEPQNTGRYAIKGNQLFIQMANGPSERITATFRDGELLEIESIKYARQH